MAEDENGTPLGTNVVDHLLAAAVEVGIVGHGHKDTGDRGAIGSPRAVIDAVDGV